ncbi:MAG: hypothetical protein CBC59_000770, partial [Euryarchaeota archaeon TMED99]
MVDKSQEKPSKKPSKITLEDRFSKLKREGTTRFQSGSVDITARVKDFDSKRAIDAVLDAPTRLKREWQKSGAIGAITRFPLATVIVFLVMTLFFVSHSGFFDLYFTQFDDDLDETDLNVNGDLEVYLPDGSEVGRLLNLVEEDWSTNVMVIYIQLEGGNFAQNNITDVRILQEISYVENMLNPCISTFVCQNPNNASETLNDDVIYLLSISTVLKEVNSSAPRIREAFITELGQLGCGLGQDDCQSAQAASSLNELFALTDDQLGGGYEIPSQNTTDLIINEMYEDDGSPSPGLDKLARDISCGFADCIFEGEKEVPDGTLDRAVMAIAVNDEVAAKDIISDTNEILDEMKSLERPCLYLQNGQPDADAGLCIWGEVNDLTTEQLERGVKAFGL